MQEPRTGSKTFYNCREDWKVAVSQGRFPKVYGTCKSSVSIPEDVEVGYDPSYNQYFASKMTFGKMIANNKNECISGRCYAGTFLPNQTYEFNTSESVARFDKN
jgi:hypothetical protein